MSVSSKKIVTLIPSATEIVAFLGEKKSIIGRSHECDYPRDLNNIVKLTSPKINVDGTSGEIDKQINTILENSLSVYKVDVKKLKNLDPDFIVTQAHCEVCAVSFSEVENIVSKHLNQKTKIISLQPNTLSEVFDDIRRVAKDLKVDNSKNSKLIESLEIRLEEIQNKTKNQKKTTPEAPLTRGPPIGEPEVHWERQLYLHARQGRDNHGGFQWPWPGVCQAAHDVRVPCDMGGTKH